MQQQPFGVIRGGIGDLLLRVDNIKSDIHYKIVSHFRQAPDLIRPYTENFEYIFMDRPIASIPGELDPVTYPSLKIPKQSLKKAQDTLIKNKPIVGIHPIGSELSRAFDRATGRPEKNMTPLFLLGLVDFLTKANTTPILFCSPNELFLYKDLNIKIIADPYIWDSIAYVSICDMVVAVDSAIKTISAIMHKPTVVLLGDYEDSGRNIFIEPYIEISTVRFTDISSVLDETLHKVKLCLEGLPT